MNFAKQRRRRIRFINVGTVFAGFIVATAFALFAGRAFTHSYAYGLKCREGYDSANAICSTPLALDIPMTTLLCLLVLWVTTLTSIFIGKRAENTFSDSRIAAAAGPLIATGTAAVLDSVALGLLYLVS